MADGNQYQEEQEQQLLASKHMFHVMSQQERGEIKDTLAKLTAIIQRHQDAIDRVEGQVNHPINGLHIRLGELEKTIVDRFHKYEMDISNKFNEIRAKEEARYAALQNQNLKELYEIQNKFRESLAKMNEDALKEYKKINEEFVKQLNALELRVRPLEDRKVASWATWQTFVIIAVAITSILNMIFNYFQGTHQILTGPKTTMICETISRFFC